MGKDCAEFDEASKWFWMRHMTPGLQYNEVWNDIQRSLRVVLAELAQYVWIKLRDLQYSIVSLTFRQLCVESAHNRSRSPSAKSASSTTLAMLPGRRLQRVLPLLHSTYTKRLHPHRGVCTEPPQQTSIAHQNRQRALEYLRKHAPNHPLHADETLDTATEKDPLLSTPHRKPTAKQVAQKRLRKHIPQVTGNVPEPKQLTTLLDSEHGAHDIVVLDVRDKATFADWMLICCGRTPRHVRAIADGIMHDMRALDVRVGGELVSVSGRDSSDWMVVDIGSVVIHVMTDDAREHYRLEGLWLPKKPEPLAESDEINL